MSIEQRLRDAASYLTEEKIDKAAEIFEEILEEDPTHLEALVGMGKVSYLANLILDARTYCQKAIEHEPDDSEAWLLLGITYEDDCPDRSLEYLKMAVDWAEKGSEAYYEFARVLAKYGYLGDALVALRTALDQDPEDLHTLMLEGELFRELEAYDDAISSFQKVIRYHRNHLPAYLALIDLLFLEEEYEMALGGIMQARRSCGSHIALKAKESSLQTLIQSLENTEVLDESTFKKNPLSLESHLNLGVFHLLQKEYKDAKESFDKAKDLAPTNWEPWFFLGELYRESESPEKAEEAYRQAHELAPQEWEPLNYIALLLLEEEGRTSEAIYLLQEAVLNNPEEEAPIFNLALAYFKNDDYNKVLEIANELEQFPAISPKVKQGLKNIIKEVEEILSK